ncbi:hypothetical protein [Streptomyces sp. NPDC048385]|uniref:hypothetical protein n=1 Tax=unclassified Streptomyces TaxID=2593676 RepID=UPI00341D4405
MTLTACGDDKKADAKEAGTPASATSAPAKPFAGLTPDQISEKSRLAMTKLKSFEVKGAMTVQGKEMTFDVAVAGKGNCLGTFTREGAAADLRWVGDHTYMKADKKFWQQTAREEGSSPEEANALTELLAGHWFKAPVGSGEADDEFPFCDAATIFTKDKKEGPLARGAETEVNGTHVVTLTGKDGAATQTLFVSAEGDPYALRMTEEGGKEPGTLDFSAFNKPVTVTPPPAGEVVDLKKLQK